ncbi:MAG: hypothetical protein ABI665_05180 [Vicinamibacterales bacterium]
MPRLAVLLTVVLVSIVQLAAQRAPRTRAPRLWTDAALSTWALPIAGVNATPDFYKEAEYYAAPVDELQTYPVYVKDREPRGYREGLRQRGPRPLIEIGRSRTDAEWVAAGREVFVGMDLPENRTASPAAMAWVDDPAAPAREKALVSRDGEIISLRWVVDRDRTLKLTLNECAACHTRVLPDGSTILGAQGNLNFNISVAGMIFESADDVRKRQGRFRTPRELSISSYVVPWLKDDIHAGFQTMPEGDRQRIDGAPATSGTFSRFNGSPFFINHMPDLIGVRDRKYLDATATHRNRGPEDIARYGILVNTADDGAIGSYRFQSDAVRTVQSRNSDDAMYALGKYLYALQPPPNPNPRNDLSARGEQVFARSGCAACHTPPLYTNNKLVAVDGFVPGSHASAPPADDVLSARVGTDPGLALRTRKGTGYYKVPSLKGVWYRGTLEHSGSVASLEEWFDPARLRDGYRSKGWNPPNVKTRPVPGHPFGLNLPLEDKQALLAFLRTL